MSLSLRRVSEVPNPRAEASVVQFYFHQPRIRELLKGASPSVVREPEPMQAGAVKPHRIAAALR